MANENPDPAFAPALGLSIVGGVCMALQSRVNGGLAENLGNPIQAALISFGGGLIVLLGLSLAMPRIRSGLRHVKAGLQAKQFPLAMTAGGTIGALLVISQSVAVPIIGVALFTIAAVAGQTSNALLVDRVGLSPAGKQPIHPMRVLAAALSIVGVGLAVSNELAHAELVVVPALAALTVGAMTSVQQALNARVNTVSRAPLATTLINFVWGTALLVIVCLGGLILGHGLGNVTDVPWWGFIGGPLGIVFIAIGAWAIRHIGVLLVSVASLLGNLAGALTIDVVAGVPHGPLAYFGVGVTFGAGVLAAYAARPPRRS